MILKLEITVTLLLVELYINLTTCINPFQNYVIVLGGCDIWKNNDTITAIPELYSVIVPKVVINCFGHRPRSGILDGPRQHIRFGCQRFTHIFYNFQTSSEPLISRWKDLYGQLTLTNYKERFFHYASTYYTKYPYYNPQVFLEDYWRSQWNQDQFDIKPSSNDNLIVESLIIYDQLPTHLEKMIKDPSLSIHKFSVLLYSPLSGWGGSRCNFYTLEQQLYELTKSYNAFDMMFCEIFNFYNLTFIADYNFPEFLYVRPFLIRDDLISSFPSDHNALFHESPGITFIVLQQSSLVWGNIARPFEIKIWIGIGISLLLVIGYNELGWRVSRSSTSRNGDQDSSIVDNLFKMNNFWVHQTTSQRLWLVFVRCFLFLFLSSYSGMILAGYLHPIYPWTPKTFKELNATTNFYVAISFDSAIERALLTKRFILNGVKLWADKFVGVNHTTMVRNPGDFLQIAESDHDHRYAMLMYNNKKKLYISSRHELPSTAKYVHRLHSDNEVVLQEMRYVSVAPGATRLHFLVDAIRQNFETGVWIRWKYLEDNYFKFVAPVVAWRYGVEYPTLLRSLNFEDIKTTVCVFGVGLVISFVAYFVECFKQSCKTSLDLVCFIIELLVNFFTGITCLLQGLIRWLQNLNQL